MMCGKAWSILVCLFGMVGWTLGVYLQYLDDMEAALPVDYMFQMRRVNPDFAEDNFARVEETLLRFYEQNCNSSIEGKNKKEHLTIPAQHLLEYLKCENSPGNTHTPMEFDFVSVRDFRCMVVQTLHHKCVTNCTKKNPDKPADCDTYSEGIIAMKCPNLTTNGTSAITCTTKSKSSVYHKTITTPPPTSPSPSPTTTTTTKTTTPSGNNNPEKQQRDQSQSNVVLSCALVLSVLVNVILVVYLWIQKKRKHKELQNSSDLELCSHDESVPIRSPVL